MMKEGTCTVYTVHLANAYIHIHRTVYVHVESTTDQNPWNTKYLKDLQVTDPQTPTNELTTAYLNNKQLTNLPIFS